MSGQRERAILNTPHPVYGIDAGGFSVGDLPACGQIGILAVDAKSADYTSDPVEICANAVELAATFSNVSTKCDITVLAADGTTVLAKFVGASQLNNDNLYVGFYDQRAEIGGGHLHIKVDNFSGGGSVSVKVRRTG